MRSKLSFVEVFLGGGDGAGAGDVVTAVAELLFETFANERVVL
jgi:hypothetical protein